MSLDRGLLAQPATVVAPLVLGGTITVGAVTMRITEVEAYLGVGVDPGSHAFRREGAKNRTMFGPPGRLYAYFTYGMHVCANIVCSPTGEASAVLLRAGEIVDGVETARARRTTSRSDADLARGPARLTVALGIGLDDDGVDLERGRVRLALPAEPVQHSTSLRTGVSGPGGGADYPWRYFVPGEPSVSPYRAWAAKGRRA